jgi:hypothetical protein
MAEWRRPAGVRMVVFGQPARLFSLLLVVYYHHHHRGEHDEPGSGSASGFIDSRRRTDG